MLVVNIIQVKGYTGMYSEAKTVCLVCVSERNVVKTMCVEGRYSCMHANLST